MSLDQHHTLGRSGLHVSRLALDAMTFGTGFAPLAAAEPVR